MVAQACLKRSHYMSWKDGHSGTMKGNLIRNENGDLAFVYGESLGFVPEWAALDIERGELSAYGGDDQSKMIFMEGMSDEIYQELCMKQQIFMVEVEDNDFEKPRKAAIVSLTVPTQI